MDLLLHLALHSNRKIGALLPRLVSLPLVSARVPCSQLPSLRNRSPVPLIYRPIGGRGRLACFFCVLVLSQQAVEVAIGLEELLVPSIAAGEESSPPAAPRILGLRFLDDELLHWPEFHLLIVRLPVVLDVVAQVAAINVPIGKRRDAGHREQICDHVALDLDVERRVGVHGGRHVDLHEPGLEVGVDEHVEAEDFVAAVVVGHVLQEGSVEDVFPREDGLDDQVVDPGEELAGFLLADVEAEEVLEGAEAPLAAEVLLVLLLALHELSVLLVYAVVGQVLELLVLAIVRVLVVGLSRKSAQPLVVDVEPQGVYAEDGDVDPEVELEVVDEERVGDVVADDQGGVFLQLG